MIKFLQKHFQGGYSIHIPFTDRYLHIPKLAPLFIVAMIIATIGDSNNVLAVKFIGQALIGLSIFIFFLPPGK
jgi:hypothetical protein